MYRDEHVGLSEVRNLGPLFQRQISITVAGKDDFRAQTALDQFSQTRDDVQYQIFFHQARAPHRAQVPAAVSGVENQAELGHVSR